MTVDSQVINYALPQIQPRIHGKNKYVYTHKDLPYFIDPRWKIGDNQEKDELSLHFILYIPPKNMSQLVIMKNNNEELDTNGFVIPQWGGVVIHNVNNQSMTDKKIILDNESIKYDISVFISQLRQLFGLNFKSDVKNIQFIYPKGIGAALWEVDLLSRDRIFYNIEETKNTLKSFSTMIKSLSYIPIYDDILNKLENSIKCMNLLTNKMSKGEYKEAIEISNDAIVYSEVVFFDENMVGILHHPDEHILAVYFPFLGPVIANLVLGLVKEIRRKKNKN